MRLSKSSKAKLKTVNSNMTDANHGVRGCFEVKNWHI